MAMTAAERSHRYRARLAAAAGRELAAQGRPRTAGHGDPARYNGGCRCSVCKAAHNARVARYRASRSVLAPRARRGAA